MANAPRWSDASGCTTAQRQPVVNAGGLVLSAPDRLLARDNGLDPTPGATGGERGGGSFGRVFPLSPDNGIGSGRYTSTLMSWPGTGSRTSLAVPVRPQHPAPEYCA